jgi:hypothetical protein
VIIQIALIAIRHFAKPPGRCRQAGESVFGKTLKKLILKKNCIFVALIQNKIIKDEYDNY